MGDMDASGRGCQTFNDPAQDQPYRMSPSEIAFGWVFGSSTRALPRRSAGDPRSALDDAIRPALRRGRCCVLFSGGRDSSGVLAAAVHLARREGLPLPAAVTFRPLLDPNAEESSWQEVVVKHLGVTDWERIGLYDEMDLVGPVVGAEIEQHGLLFPAGLAAHRVLYERTQGATVLTGELGDEVFDTRRALALQNVRTRRVLRPSRIPSLYRELAPRPLRYRLLLRSGRRNVRPWLTAAAAQTRARLVARDESLEPLDWRLAIWRTIDRPAVRAGIDSMGWFARQFDVTLEHPLMDETFVARFAAAGGRLGYRSRREAMTTIFGSVLPAPVLARTSKAIFNASRFGAHTRAFARAWDGSGVDLALVDPDALRNEWLTERPHPSTSSLLQQAWLFNRGKRTGTVDASA